MIETQPEYFGFLLLPEYPMAPLASAIDVLTLANYVSEEKLYDWCTLSVDSDRVTALNGIISIIDYPIATAPRLNAVSVCCGVGGHRYESPELSHWLRKHYAMGARIGALSTGSWILARAGLLHRRRCTLHWEELQAFRETFPQLRATDEIFEVDGRIFTCSGGAAATDMFLSFVAIKHGFELAVAVAEQLVHGPVRPHQTSQRTSLQNRIGISNKWILKAIRMMENHLEETLTLGEIGESLGTSSRHLERLFRKHLGKTPQLYYREMRLRQAQNLLRSTTMPVAEIAFALGFNTASYFSKCYADLFGRTPSRERAFIKLPPGRSGIG